MFIAGTYQNDRLNQHNIQLDLIASSISQELLSRGRKSCCIRGDKIFFISNKEIATSSDLDLVYCGNFFNLDLLISRISLPKDSATEAVLGAAYKKWGDDFAKYIKGEFAIAVYDKKNHKLLLCRDRVGLKPLYYFFDGSLFIFAPEVKALLKATNKRVINFRSLHSGILFGSVYSNEHLIEAIHELRAGHTLILNEDSKFPIIYKYWDRVFDIYKRPKSAYENEFKLLLKEAVKKRLPLSNTKVGIAFSGGVDSTLVLALVKKIYPGPIETYTAIAEGDKTSEFRDARLAAEHFQVQHKEVFISALEAVQILPKIIWYMGEFSAPYFYSIPVQTYFVAKLAKENGSGDIFTGNGVEHNFDGNGPQRALYKYFYNSGRTPRLIRDRLLPLLPYKLQNLLRKKCSYLWTTKMMNDIPEEYIYFNTMWRRESYLKKLYTKDFLSLLGGFSSKDILSQYLNECSAQEYFNKLLYIDFKTWNSRRNLVTNERLFSPFGIRLQIPFLDSDLIQFSSSLPVNIKHNFHDEKYFIRKLYKNSNILPSKIFNKGKYGSMLHFKLWEEPILSVISCFVEKLKKRRIFREDFIDQVLSGAKKLLKKDDYYSWIIELFELELWFRIFIDHSDIEENNLTLDYLVR